MDAVPSLVVDCCWDVVALWFRLGGAALITKLFEKRASSVDPIHPRDPALAAMFGLGADTHSKINVTEDTAMRFSAVYAAIRIIAETVASLPIKVFERKAGGGRAEVSSHPVSTLMAVEPNRDMTPMVYRETSQSHILSWGNSFDEIVMNGRGEAVELIPRHPSRVRPFRSNSGMLQYDITYDSGENRTLDRSQVMHVPGLGGDGIVGWSPIRLMRESIGMGLAAERFGARFYGNAARPSMVAKHKGVLGDEAYARLKKDLDNQYSADNSHGVLLFEDDMDVTILTMPLEEAQFLESRKFQVVDIARIYRIPPHMLAEMDRATFSNIEQQSLDFEKHTLRPWLVRREQEVNRKLFSGRQKGRYFIKHVVEGLLRADINTRFSAYAMAFQNGWLNIDEIREREDLNPLPDGQGQVYVIPLNLQPVDDIGEEGDSLDGDPPQEDNSGERQFLEHLLTDTVEGLIGREVHRAERAAKKPGEFLTWLDDFYVDHQRTMQKKLGDRFAGEITNHVEESRRLLLEVSGRANADNFELELSIEVDSWVLKRAEFLVNAILGESKNEAGT